MTVSQHLYGKTGHEHGCTCRRCRILTLLDLRQLVTERGTATQGNGDASHIPQLTAEAHHRSYRELERILYAMCAQPLLKDRRHMVAYFDASTHLVNRQSHVPGPRRGKKISVQVRLSERLVPDWVSLDRVRNGIQYVDDHFQGDPSLPEAFLKDRPHLELAS